MDFSYLTIVALLCVLLLDCSSIVHGYDFQCLTCDNFIDGPGCGEFTKQIPVRNCRTFCYFAILQNRTSSIVPSSAASRRHGLTSIALMRAIRDCSPYEDMSIEGNLLLESKLGSLSPSIDIITLKRCNSEQCNNDFYLKPDDVLPRGKSCLTRSIPFPLLFSLSMIIFYLKINF